MDTLTEQTLASAVQGTAEAGENTIQEARGSRFSHAILAALGIGVGLFALLLGCATCGMEMFLSYFSSPLVVLLNVLPPVLLIMLVYFLSGRAWLGFTIPSAVILTLAIIDYFKLLIRGDPLLGEDMTLISESGIILQSYSLPIHWSMVLAVLFFAFGIFLTVRLLKNVRETAKVRIIGAAAIVAICAMLYLFVYKNDAIYAQTAPPGEPVPFSEGYIARGFVYPFLYSTGRSAAPPEGYSEEAVEEVLATVEDGGIPPGKQVNIISIMLESYGDLSKFEALEFIEDVYAPLHSLQREAVSGTLIDNVFAGGTIDTERLFLTGYTKLDKYEGPVNSFVHYLNSQGYTTEGMHAGDRWFYDREIVNGWLGFQNYYFLDDYENSTREDSFFFPEVLRLYRERDVSKPYFSYNLTYQNHGAYPGDWTTEPHMISDEGLTDAAFNTLNNYLTGIYDTNLRLAAFIDELRDDPEPVVVVVFGDHMPLLGNSESVYRELGITVDAATEEGFYNLYSTPYFIWANSAAQRMMAHSFTGNGGSFSPCFLMSRVFELCQWKGDEYMQMLSGLRLYTDIINTPTGYFRERGKLTYTLTDQARKYYEDFQKVEYHRQNNFAYGEEEPNDGIFWAGKEWS